MVVKNITKEKFSDEDSQVSHLSHPENDDDVDGNSDGNAKAQFAAATTSVNGGDNSTVATGKSDGAAAAATDYATLCGVKRSRVLIVLTILAVGGIVGGLAYYFTSRNEQQDFEAEVSLFSWSLFLVCIGFRRVSL